MDDPYVLPVWWSAPDAIRRRDRLLLLLHASGRREAWLVDASGRLRWTAELPRKLTHRD